MRAFLSYSSKDKTLVDEVARNLGRQFCLYDTYAFDTGDDLVEAIKRCLDKAAVFVLFASNNSRASLWVNMEIDEAHDLKLRDSIRRSVVYMIDETTKIEHLPEWMRRAVIRRNNAPGPISREIRSHLDELQREKKQEHFVGRGSDMSLFEEALAPTDGSIPPHLFIVSGLPGIGRRTLLRHGAANLLSLPRTIEIRLSEGDSVNDICVKTADVAETFASGSDFKAAFHRIQETAKDQAIERIKRNLRVLVAGGELPVFIDEGGFLDTEGFIAEPAIDLLKSAITDEGIYIGFITHRKPQGLPDIRIPTLRLNPLGREDTKRLLARLASSRDLTVSSTELSDIAEYVAGYPPSAYFAIEQATEYGVGLVVDHKRRLVQFRTGVFLRHIQGLGLETAEGGVLQLLATYSPLPLVSILSALRIDLERADAAITRLIDFALVIADRDGLYRISDPVADSALSVYGIPSPAVSLSLGLSITELLASCEVSRRYLELSRVLFRASMFSDDKDLVRGSLCLASDMIRLTEEYYHSRQYERSIECGKLAVSQRPNSVTGRSYLIRSLVQKEKWDEALAELERLGCHAPPRDIHFLRGFLERRRGDCKSAIAEFLDARRYGRRGAALSRELSHAYYLTGDAESAREHLRDALASHGDNRFVVDLWAQLATDLGDEAEARKALERLEVVDSPMFYNYRRSRIEWRFGDIQSARAAAQAALAKDSRPPFAVLAQATLCDIAAGNLGEASALLARLDHDFGDIKRDIRTGLHCRIEIASGNSTEALRLSDRFSCKDSRYYRLIRLEALKGELSGGKLDASSAERYRREYDELGAALGGDLKFDIPEVEFGPG